MNPAGCVLCVVAGAVAAAGWARVVDRHVTMNRAAQDAIRRVEVEIIDPREK
jgi:hypothetical protein